MATSVRMTLRAVPVGRDRKIRTALSTHHIAGFVTVPSEKKSSTPYTSWLQSNFPSPEEARKNMSNEQISARTLC